MQSIHELLDILSGSQLEQATLGEVNASSPEKGCLGIEFMERLEDVTGRALETGRKGSATLRIKVALEGGNKISLELDQVARAEEHAHEVARVRRVEWQAAPQGSEPD